MSNSNKIFVVEPAFEAQKLMTMCTPDEVIEIMEIVCETWKNELMRDGTANDFPESLRNVANSHIIPDMDFI